MSFDDSRQFQGKGRKCVNHSPPNFVTKPPKKTPTQKGIFQTFWFQGLWAMLVCLRRFCHVLVRIYIRLMTGRGLMRIYLYHKILQIDEIYTTILNIQCLARQILTWSRWFCPLYRKDRKPAFSSVYTRQDLRVHIPSSTGGFQVSSSIVNCLCKGQLILVSQTNCIHCL